MIRKLRLRFIISALLSIFIVLAATIAAINFFNYSKSERETESLLDQVIDRERESIRRQYQGYWGDYFGGGGTMPDPEGHIYKESDPSKDDPRGQYFVTVFGTDGNVWYTNFHIISADKTADQEMAITIYNGLETNGKKDNYRYKKVYAKDTVKYQQQQGGFMGTSMEPQHMETTIEAVYVAFVDTTESIHAVNNYIVNSIIIASVSYTVIAALIIISSHFVFKTSEESYRKQKAFITNASHELKTPLTIINTDIEILKMDHGESEWADSISDQVRRLTVMTNQLVTLSKLDEDNMRNYPFATFSLSKLAKESANAFAPTFEKNGYKFESDIEDDLTIKANEHLINELFYIFMDNALKYTKEKGFINLSVKKNKLRTEIVFSNDIEDDEMDVNLLFERFYRSPKSNKKEGSGIGLSIAKEIVDLHKAKINVFIKNQKIFFVINF